MGICVVGQIAGTELCQYRLFTILLSCVVGDRVIIVHNHPALKGQRGDVVRQGGIDEEVIVRMNDGKHHSIPMDHLEKGAHAHAVMPKQASLT